MKVLRFNSFNFLFLFLFLFLSFCLINSYAWAQQCDNSRPLSTPDDKFFINDDGTITDIDNGLTWMRCAIGQEWNGNTCTGEAKLFSWRAAFKEEDKINQGKGYASLSNWRLPKLPELASIVERQCDNPRINLKIFPATPASPFWTANHKKIDEGAEPQAFSMDFKKSGLQVFPQLTKLHLRLVSGRN